MQAQAVLGYDGILHAALAHGFTIFIMACSFGRVRYRSSHLSGKGPLSFQRSSLQPGHQFGDLRSRKNVSPPGDSIHYESIDGRAPWSHHC